MLDQCSSDVARIADSMPPDPTTAQVLLLLTSAWSSGHAHGVVAGAQMVSGTMEMVQRAITGERRD